MNIKDLIIEVRDASYARVGQLMPQDLVGFQAVLRFNNVGSWEMKLPATHPLADAITTPGFGILVTGPNGVILSGPTVSVVNERKSEDPEGTWTIQGVDDSILLAERLAYPTPTIADVTAQTTSHDIRTGPASTVMYGYVRANLGDLAPAERQVGLTVATDPGIGTVVYKSARYDQLGEMLAGIASIDGLGFDIKQNGSVLQFLVWQPVDRTGTIRMDITNNTLSSSSYGYGSPKTTRAIVGGGGEGLNRKMVEVTTTESTAAQTLWDRRIESFVDENNTTDTNELTQAGKEALAEDGITVTSIDVTPSSDTTMRYGVDWGLGDKVTVVIGSQETKAIVTTVAMSIQPDGVRIGATVGQPTGVDYEALVSKRQTEQSKKIAQLELKEVPAIVWNDAEGTYEFVMKGGNVTQQIGAEQLAYVKNATGAALLNGRAVYPIGSSGTNQLVAYAQANSESTSTRTFGVLTEDLNNGNHGWVTTFGMVHNIDTSALTEGAAVWLSPTVAGGLTSTKPSAPDHMVLIGFCVRSHAVNGSIFVKVQNGFELDELHDVAIASKATGDLLVSTATGWSNKTPTAAGIATTTALNDGLATKAPLVHTHSGSAITSGQVLPEYGGQPTGSVISFAGSTAPNGYLLCQGQAVSRTTYAALFAVIGGTYGVGDGSTTFNLPDLRGRVAVGVDSGGIRIPSYSLLGQSSGAATHTLTAGQTPLVYGGWTWHGAEGGGPGWNMFGNAFSNTSINWSYYRAPGPSYGGAHSITNVYFHNGGNNEAHNNLQPYLILNSIIKT